MLYTTEYSKKYTVGHSVVPGSFLKLFTILSNFLKKKLDSLEKSQDVRYKTPQIFSHKNIKNLLKIFTLEHIV